MRIIIIPLGSLLLLLIGMPLPAQVIEEDAFFNSAMQRFFDKDDAFYPSIRITQEYDDNIRLEPEEPKEGSWKTYLAPTVQLEFPGDQTYFRLAYTPTFIIYWTRDDVLDLNQHATLNIKHNLTPRDIIGLEDIFIRKEDPEDIRPASSPPRRNADYNRNHLISAYTHNLTKKYIIFFKYRNERDEYDKESGLAGLDYWSNNGEAYVRYQASPSNKLECFYRYRVNDYDTYDSDYQSHLLALEFEYRLGKDLIATLGGGYESRYYKAGRRLKSPYAGADFLILLSQVLEIDFKYWYRIEDTFELSYLGYRGQGINAEATVRISPRIFLTLSSSAELANFPASLSRDGEQVSAREKYLKNIISVTYEARKDLFLEVGYIRTDNNSDFVDASYQRNQGYVRINLFL